MVNEGEDVGGLYLIEGVEIDDIWNEAKKIYVIKVYLINNLIKYNIF